MRYFIISILIAGGLIFPAGCSDSQRYDYDNQYDSELIDSDYESISRDIETPEKEELPVLDANSTLKDYLSYAALNNASLKSAFQSWRAGLEQIPQAEALPDPQFTYSYYIQEVETRVGPQEHKLGIMQKFPWFGKIEARTDAAAASARVAREEYRTQKLEVFRRVKSTYAEYAYLHKAIDIARENLQLLEHFEEVARTQYRAAAATHPDVIRAQIETAKIRDTLESLEQLQPAIAAELNAALNRPSGADLPKPQPLNPVKEKIDDRELLSMVKNLNPELRAINERIIEAEQKVELARKRRYPDIGAGVSWTQTGDAVNPGVSDSGTDPVMLTFAMNLPLWTDSYSAGERQAEARVRQRRFEKTEKENVLSAKAGTLR
jgi:outer membrane protein TolC